MNQLDLLSIQIIVSYMNRIEDVKQLVEVNKKYNQAIKTTRYPTLISYSNDFSILFPNVTSVIIDNESIQNLGSSIWQKRLININSIDLYIDENTPEESLLFHPNTYSLIQSIKIKNNLSRNTYILVNDLIFYPNIIRIEMNIKLLMFDNHLKRQRSNEDIQKLIVQSNLKMIVLHDYNVEKHEIVKLIIGNWKGRALCYLKKKQNTEKFLETVNETPRNMLHFLATSKITDSDIKLLKTQIVLFKKVNKGIVMFETIREMLTLRALFQLYGIDCVGIDNCTAEKGHKIFLKFPLIRRLKMKGELMMRPWFFNTVEDIEFTENILLPIEMFPKTDLNSKEYINEFNKMLIKLDRHYNYNMLEVLKKIELNCSVYTMNAINMPTNIEELKVTLISNQNELTNEWNMKKLSKLKKLTIKNLIKKEHIKLPKTLESLQLENIEDTYFDFYNLSKFTALTYLELNKCDDIPRIVLPTSLQSLIIQNCEYIKKMVNIEKNTNLQSIQLINCPELEWNFEFKTNESESENEEIQEIFPVKKIEIKYCDSIRSINLQHYGDLEELILCCELTSLQINYNSLTRLELYTSTSLSSIQLTSLSTNQQNNETQQINQIPEYSFDYINNTFVKIDYPVYNQQEQTYFTTYSNYNGYQSSSSNILPLKLQEVILMNQKENIPFNQLVTVSRLTIINYNEKNLLDTLPNSHLKYLTLEKVSLSHGIVVPTSLIKLFITNCSINSLIDLKSCFNLQMIEISNCFDLSTISIPFNLIELKLKNIPSLTGIIHIPNSYLLSMEIVECSSLEVFQIPLTLHSFKCENCINLNTLMNINISKLHRLILQYLPSLKELQIPNSLIDLHINSCYELNQIIGLESIENPGVITITNCPTLSYYSFPIQQQKYIEFMDNSINITTANILNQC